MPDPNDILNAMREAGEDFAKMADTIEGKLPGIAKALARAPRYLKPLVRDLKTADALTNQFIQSLDKVDDVLKSAAVGTGKLVRNFMFLRGEAGKTASAVNVIAEKMDKFGSSLKERTRQFASLRAEQEKLAKNGPDLGGGGNLGNRNHNNGAAGDKDADDEAAVKTREDLTKAEKDYWPELKKTDEQLKAVEMSLKVMGTVAKQASGELNAEQAKKYGTEMLAVAKATEDASKASGNLNPIPQVMLDRVKETAEALEKLDKDAKKGEIAKAMQANAAAVKQVRSAGQEVTNITKEYMELANTIPGLTAASAKNEAEIVKLVAKKKGAMDELVKGGMPKFAAQALTTLSILKEMPGSVGAVTKEVAGLGKKLSGIGSWDAVGIAKAWINIGDSIKEDRQEIMDFTSEAGTLSAMFQSGMGAEQITGEFDKLRTSMNNLMGTWGKSRQEVQGAMKSLTAAGFSMAELTGPTLEAGEGFTSLAKSGEYAMSGMKQIATISALTGKSMGDVAAMAGQWREKMGVDITSVGNTYLELESAARRSGLSIGKFMDRIMASSSGFILMGGNMDEVAGSLSNLMGAMDLPPGMAADIAGNFMDRLNKMTVDDAMMGIGLVGDAGAKVLQEGAQIWADQRSKEAKKLGEDIAKLEAEGPKKGKVAEYNAKLEKLRGEHEKAAADATEYARLIVAAAKGDRNAQSLLLQEEARRGHATAQELAILEDLSAMGVDVNKVVSDQRGHAIAGYEEMKKLEKTASGRIILEKRATQKGYASYKEMLAISKGQANQAKTTQEFARILAAGDKEMEEAVLVAAKTKDAGAILDALGEMGGKELGNMLLEVNKQGGKVAQRVFDELATAEGDVDKQREIVAKAMAKDFEGVKIETMAEEAARLAQEQTGYQKKMEEYLNAIQKWMGPLMGVLMAIRLAQDIGMFKNAGMLGKVGDKFKVFGGKALSGFKYLGGKLGTLGKFIGGKLGTLGKFLGDKLPVIGKALKIAGGAAGGALKTAGGAVGGVVSKAAGAISGVGLKGLASIAGKVAAPLALAAASYALIKGITKMSDVYKKAKDEALKAGKTEAQARKIAIEGLKTMDAAEDIISTGLSYIMGDMLAGKLTGMLTWIPGFEDMWADVIDVAMMLADGFTTWWNVVKPVLKTVGGYLLNYLLTPIKLLFNGLKTLIKVLGHVGSFFKALFSWDVDGMKKALSNIVGAIWDGIKGALSILAGAFGDLPALFWKGIKSLPGLLWKGIKALPGLFWKAIVTWGKMLKAAWYDLPKWILGLFVKLLGYLKTKFFELIDALNPVKKIKKAAKAVASTPGNIAMLLKAPGQARARREQQSKIDDYTSKLSPEAQERLKAIRAARQGGAPPAIAPPPPPTGTPTALGPSAEDIANAAHFWKLEKEKAKKSEKKATITDNSQWNVHINTRSEKEMEQAMLKTLQKHQQKLAN